MDKIQERITYLEDQPPFSDGHRAPHQSVDVTTGSFDFYIKYNTTEVDLIEDADGDDEAFNLKYDIEIITGGLADEPRWLEIKGVTVQDLSTLCDALRRFRG